MARRKMTHEERLLELEDAGLEMLVLARGFVLRELRAGRMPLTPRLADELEAFAEQIDEAFRVAGRRPPPRPLPPIAPGAPPALRVVEGGRR